MSSTMCPALLIPRGGAAAPSIAYLLRDEFTTTESAPLASPRTCEPGPGTLTLLQSDGQFSIASGQAENTAAAVAVYGNNGFQTANYTRTAGRLCVSKVSRTATSNNIIPLVFGTQTTYRHGWIAGTGSVYPFTNGSVMAVANSWAWTSGGDAIELAVVLRATGAFWLVRQAGETVWRLAHVTQDITTATVGFAAATAQGRGKWDRFVIPDTLWTPTPVASDSFNRANGSFGNTDGAGAEETGGSGLAWSTLIGSPAIASNQFSAPGTSGGDGITLDAALADVVAIVPHLGGANLRTGVIVRATDANNYYEVSAQRFTTFNIWKIEGGVRTSVASASPTVNSGTTYPLVVTCEGTTIRAYLEGISNSTIAYTGSFNQTATRHGVISTGIAATVDWFALFNRFQAAFPEV